MIGGGTGDWDVPVGGMGAVTGELARAAREAGAELVTGAEVTAVTPDGEVRVPTTAPSTRARPPACSRTSPRPCSTDCSSQAGASGGAGAARARWPRVVRERLRRSPSPRAPRSR